MGRLSSAERTEGSAESEEVKQSNFRFHIEVIILFALNMYVQDLGLGRRKVIVVNVKPDYHEILKYMDRVRSTRGGDSTDFVKFRPRRWVSNPFASSILLTVDRSGLRIHAS